MKKILLSFLIMLSLGFVFLASPVLAQGTDSACTGSDCLNNPLKVSSVNQLIGKSIQAIMGVVGSLALLMFVYGGLTWMTSSGNQNQVKKGKDILIWSAVGLVVIFGAYGITKFIIDFASK